MVDKRIRTEHCFHSMEFKNYLARQDRLSLSLFFFLKLKVLPQGVLAYRYPVL